MERKHHIIAKAAAQHQAALSVTLPFLASGAGLSTAESAWVSSRAQLLPCFKWGVVLIKYVRLTSGCRCWGVPCPHLGASCWSQPVSLTWRHSLLGLHLVPSTASTAAPLQHELFPRRTLRVRTAPGEGTKPAGCCSCSRAFKQCFFKFFFSFIRGNMHKCLKQSTSLQCL